MISSSQTTPIPTFSSEELMHPPNASLFVTPIANRFSIIAIIESTIKKGDAYPSFIAYDARLSMLRGEETYVRLESFAHKSGECARFESYSTSSDDDTSDSESTGVIHDEEYCFLLNGFVHIPPSYLAETCPFGPPSETRKHGLILLRKLGSGGFGQVFLAHDLERSTVSNPIFSAVKIQKPSDTIERRAARKVLAIKHKVVFQRLLSRHRNFVKIHRAFEEDGHYVMVMDLMNGDLHSMLAKDRGALVGDMPRARSILNQLFDAVEYMHKNGVYHRDIKPKNILLSFSSTETETETIHITDFGLTTKKPISIPSSSASTSIAAGTPMYEPPELLLRFPTLNRSNDLWSLTLTIFNFLVGSAPWAKASMKHSDSEVKDWDYHFDEFYHNRSSLEERFPISSAFGAFLKKCLNPAVKERLSLVQMREELMGIDNFWLSAEEIATLERDGMKERERAVVYAKKLGLERFVKVSASDLDTGENIMEGVDVDVNASSCQCFIIDRILVLVLAISTQLIYFDLRIQWPNRPFDTPITSYFSPPRPSPLSSEVGLWI